MMYTPTLQGRISSCHARVVALNELTLLNKRQKKHTPRYVDDLKAIAKDEALDFGAVFDSAMKDLKERGARYEQA